MLVSRRYCCRWSSEIKEIYDAHKSLRIVISGSSLIRLNDGDADLSRRMVPYLIPGLSFREYLLMEKGIVIDSISLDNLLESPNRFCTAVKKKCHPLEFFREYLKNGYYPFCFIDYLINVELSFAYNGLHEHSDSCCAGETEIIADVIEIFLDGRIIM